MSISPFLAPEGDEKNFSIYDYIAGLCHATYKNIRNDVILYFLFNYQDNYIENGIIYVGFHRLSGRVIDIQNFTYIEFYPNN